LNRLFFFPVIMIAPLPAFVMVEMLMLMPPVMMFTLSVVLMPPMVVWFRVMPMVFRFLPMTRGFQTVVAFSPANSEIQLHHITAGIEADATRIQTAVIAG
jgi:hypothetical protein